jgi:hypothetical protein
MTLNNYGNENDRWTIYINNDVKNINMNVAENLFLDEIVDYDKEITILINEINLKYTNIRNIENENTKIKKLIKDNDKKIKKHLSNITKIQNDIKRINTLILSNNITLINLDKYKNYNDYLKNKNKELNILANYQDSKDNIKEINNILNKKIQNNNNDLDIIQKLISNNHYVLPRGKNIFNNSVLDNYNSIKNKFVNINENQKRISNKKKELKNEKKIIKKIKIQIDIDNLENDIKQLKKKIDEVVNDLKKNKNNLKDKNNNHMNDIKYNDNIIKYINAFNLNITYNTQITNKPIEINNINDNIQLLRNDNILHELNINENLYEIDIINNEINELNKIKNEKVTLLNISIKNCNKISTDISNNFFDIKNIYNLCKNNSICNNSISNILCNIDPIYCDNWFTNVTTYFNNFLYNNTCNNIQNKDLIDKNNEGFTNYTTIEPFEIQYNPNKISDINNTNYYSNILIQSKNLDDFSQNMVDTKRNIEIDLFYIEKYRAQIDVLKYIIFICCISLFGSVMYHNRLLTDTLYTGYLTLVFVIGLIIILYKLFDIFIRNNNNFKEYDYNFIYKPPTVTFGDVSNNIELSDLPTDC